ncbi:uncharacterized protein LOC115889303 isoform X2 [Sitophilus oryzae]|uniref:Uncharacterized protein LOC115889303 isoform X2 n=1 Tax=Sitophilus oryzae TaxID=7048 RepID=A0A6J2YP42_SITOR|nr:uncharacterized protein LOC115889303 isoform X2 [Sitophilus oryzae]
MKYSVAFILVIISLSAAEPPVRGGVLARQEQPPYQARGFRPAGPAFNLPQRSQRQQQLPVPAASYGPPPQEYGPPAEPTTETPTTTETIEATTTLEPQAESFKVSPTKDKLTDTPQASINPAALYVVVPQAQNLIYASAPITSAKLVVPAQVQQVQQPRLVPVQAVPAFAKIQEVPQVAQVVEYQNFAPVQAVPVVSSAYTAIINTPYSSSFVQSFQ